MYQEHDARKKTIEALATLQFMRAVALDDRMSRFIAADHRAPRSDTVDEMLKSILATVEDTLGSVAWREQLPEALAIHQASRPRAGDRLRRASNPDDVAELLTGLRNQRPWKNWR